MHKTSNYPVPRIQCPAEQWVGLLRPACTCPLCQGLVYARYLGPDENRFGSGSAQCRPRLLCLTVIATKTVTMTMTMTSIEYCNFTDHNHYHVRASPSRRPRSPTSLKSRRPIPGVAVTKVVPHKEATSHLRPRGLGIQRRNPPPSNRKLVVAPRRKNSLHLAASSCAPAIPGRYLIPSLAMRHFSSTSMPLLARPRLLTPADLGSMVWVPRPQPREAGLDARATAVACSLILPLGIPRPSQPAGCDVLSRKNPWTVPSAIPSWNGKYFQRKKSQVRHATAGRGR